MKSIEEILEYVFKQLSKEEDMKFEREMDNDEDLAETVNSVIIYCDRYRINSYVEYMRSIKKTYPARDKIIAKTIIKEEEPKVVVLAPKLVNELKSPTAIFKYIWDGEKYVKFEQFEQLRKSDEEFAAEVEGIKVFCLDFGIKTFVTYSTILNDIRKTLQLPVAQKHELVFRGEEEQKILSFTLKTASEEKQQWKRWIDKYSSDDKNRDVVIGYIINQYWDRIFTESFKILKDKHKAIDAIQEIIEELKALKNQNRKKIFIDSKGEINVKANLIALVRKKALSFTK